MNEPEKELEQSKNRKKKLDLNELWVKYQALESSNLENLFRHKAPIKNSQGVEIIQCF